MTQKIFCLILNYRHFQDTAKCLVSLIKSDTPKGVNYLILDNSPDNLSVQYFKKKFPKIKVIKNPSNFGFAGGNNIGVSYALKQRATHILIINPDVFVGKSFLKILVADLNQNKKAGIIAPIIRHQQKGVTFFGMQGSIDWKTGKASHTNLRQLPKNKGVIGANFVTFACVLIRADVFRKVGLLDERYFMYLEDVDYCLQTKRLGFEILLDQKVIVDHNTSSSFKKPTDKLLISFGSQITFIKKWLSFPRNIFPLIYTLFFYPYLFILWTYHYYRDALRDIKRSIKRQGQKSR